LVGGAVGRHAAWLSEQDFIIPIAGIAQSFIGLIRTIYFCVYGVLLQRDTSRPHRAVK
jgi:hypothetical protein